MEIHSEHGGSESDRGTLLGLRHSVAGGSTAGTAQYALARGIRFGFCGGSDDHWGSPGTCGEGLMGAWAAANTREAIFDAIRARRTYALTGDRIQLSVELNGSPMGTALAATSRRTLSVKAEAWDEIDRIEVLRNNRVVHRVHPVDSAGGDFARQTRARIKLLIRFGWGQYAEWIDTLDYAWDLRIRIHGGELLDWAPVFRHGPFSEDHVDEVSDVSSGGCRITAITSRRHCLNDDATKGIWLEIAGAADTKLSVEATSPGACTITRTLGELCESNHIQQTGPPPSPSVFIHRPVWPEAFRGESQWVDDGQGGRQADWYYVRIMQSNGQMAWSSPIWVEPQ